jgi:hypothetical protein
MARLLVRDRAMHEFQIDESALPFWETRVEVLDRIPDIGEEPAEPELAESPPEESGDPATPPITPKTSTKTGKIEDK